MIAQITLAGHNCERRSISVLAIPAAETAPWMGTAWD
jgi:hypothetical protein